MKGYFCILCGTWSQAPVLAVSVVLVAYLSNCSKSRVNFWNICKILGYASILIEIP